MAILPLQDSANSNSRVKLDGEVPVRQVVDIASGNTVLVDDRTFDPALHEELDARAARLVAEAGAKAPKGKASKSAPDGDA